jgi:hypothetical protein
MQRILASLALLGLGLFVGGCLEITESYTVNPDGTGKVVLDHLSPADSQFQPTNQPKPKPEEVIKKALQDQVNKSKGIEAWSELSCEITKDGRVHLHGVGYFPDVSKARVMSGSASNNDDSGGVKWDKDGDGVKLTFIMKNKEAPAAGNPPPAALTDAELDEKIKQERVNYQQMKPLMNAFLGTLKISVTYVLPGKITEANILVPKDNTATLSIEGKQIIEAMDRVNADDKLMREKLKGGKEAEDRMMNEQIFGKKGEPFIKVAGPLKPLFDYKADAAKAKAAEAEMFKKLGITAKAP